MSYKIICLFTLLIVFAWSCEKNENKLISRESSIIFSEVSADQSGIKFRNQLFPTEELNIITYLYYYNGGGIAAGDINNDGLIDLYFTANQGADALFLNQGNLQFRDITASSGLSMAKDWSSGAAFVDIDADGDLDLYVNKVSGVAGLIGRNELYINDGTGSFSERAVDFGLDFSGLATQTAFSDFDGDGDLDAYLLNHSIHDTERRIDTSMRRASNPLSGDRLYLQSENGLFVNSSASSGIYQSRLGYGLGLAVADFTGDRFPEIYASNDFNENDYFYVNQGNGSFVESIASTFPFSSKFSMGNVAADINSDGKLDLLTLDMRPASDSIRKSSAGDSDPRQFERQRQLGFLDQQARNVLHLSCDNQYSESAILYGIHSTDWSWSPLIADFNLDGRQDIFIANGIWQRPNDLDYLKFTSAKAIQRNASNLDLANLMPSGQVANHLYLGSDVAQPLKNVASALGLGAPGSSTAALALDLDNDGDLDLITNNVNAPAQLFENTASKIDSTHTTINIELKGSAANPYAIGAKIRIETDSDWERLIVVQPVTGFQSSAISSNLVTLPRGHESAKVTVTWPDGTSSVYEGVAEGTITISHQKGKVVKRSQLNTILDIQLTKQNSAATDFFFENPLQPLIYLPDSKASDLPRYFNVGTIVAKLADGTLTLNDTLIKNVAFVEQLSNGRSLNSLEPGFDVSESQESLRLLVAQKVVDGSFRLFILQNKKSGQVVIEQHSAFKQQFRNVSSIQGKSGKFLIQPSLNSYASQVYILEESDSYTNPSAAEDDKSLNVFTYKLIKQSISVPQTQVTDVYTDKDTTYIARLWAPVEKRWFDDSAGKVNQEFIGLKGLWTSICPFNDSLILFHNVGYNNLLVEHPDQKLELHLADYDRNGEIDPIAVRVENGSRRTMFGLDDIAEQMPTLRKFFTSYLPFSSSTFDQMFPTRVSKGATVLESETLTSVLYNKRTGILTDKPDSPKSCQQTSFCKKKGKLYLHPSLRSAEN